MEGQEETQQPHLILANKLFLLTHADVPDIEKVRLRDEVFQSVKADGNAVGHFHRALVSTFPFGFDSV